MSSSAGGPIELGSIDMPEHAAEPIAAGYPGALLAHLDVSVVVPTYRRPAMLAACLHALIAQDFAQMVARTARDTDDDGIPNLDDKKNLDSCTAPVAS